MPFYPALHTTAGHLSAPRFLAVWATLSLMLTAGFAAGSARAQRPAPHSSKPVPQPPVTLGKGQPAPHVIRISGTAPGSVRKAAQELQSYMGKVLGFTPLLQEDTVPPTEPFISLGATRDATAAGIDAAAIRNDGYRIASRGQNLFILGPDTQDGEITPAGGQSAGTANGVYVFVEEFLGLHWLLPGGLGEEYTPRASLQLPALDHSYSPPFDYRVLPYIRDDRQVRTWATRLRQAKLADVRHSHNWDYAIPAALFEKHPDWFAQIGGKRVPPSGRYKLETTNAEMIQAFAASAKAAFRKDPKLRFFSLSPSDGGGWSESAASRALYDKTPSGALSLTRLVLTFYNEVAKQVGKEFPDRKVAGYIYADYLYPPSSGMPALEPNLALVVAPSISYGYRLYRSDVQKEWDALMGAWGKLAGQADLYYYDLPTYLKQSNGLLLPPAPEILNFVYSRLSRYGYKGAYVYGSPIWPAAGPGNYALAQLNWNPAADAHRIVADYYRMAYGPAAPHVATMYQLVDSGLERYYQRHEDASYNLTPAYLPEVYAPIQAQLEAEYARALALELSPKQRRRLEHLGQVLALQQFNLRVNGALPAGYQSPLTLDQNKVDAFFGSGRAGDVMGPVLLPASSPPPPQFAPRLANPAAPWQAALEDQSLVPVRGVARLALFAPRAGNVEIRVRTLDTRAEFAHFAVTDTAGKEISAGVMSKGRTLSFAAQAGATYFLTLQNVWTSFRLQVEGALPAYQANFTSRGFRLELHEIPQQGLPLTVTVPPGTGSFSILISGRGALVDVVNPQGQTAGQIDTRQSTADRLVVPDHEAKPGTWTLRFAPAPTQEALLGYIVLDAKLPQWLGTTPAAPLQFGLPAP